MGQPVVYFEIGCRDTGKTSAFFSQMFDWNVKPGDSGAGLNTGTSEGIEGHIVTLGHEPHNYVTFYVQVEDLQASLDKAASLGGKTIVSPTEVPGSGHFAWIADPEGNTVGLWKPNSPSP